MSGPYAECARHRVPITHNSQLNAQSQHWIDAYSQLRVGFTDGGFNSRRVVATGEDEAEIACAFRQRHDRVVEAGADLDAGDAGHGERVVNAVDAAQDALCGD